MDGCNIFREELAIRYPTHGHALWEPDPGGLYEAVEVGDVGLAIFTVCLMLYFPETLHRIQILPMVQDILLS